MICDAGPLASARCQIQRMTTEKVPLPEGWLEVDDPFGRQVLIKSRRVGLATERPVVETVRLHLCPACQTGIPGREDVDTRDFSWEFVRLGEHDDGPSAGDVLAADVALWRAADGEQRWMTPEQERELGLVRPDGVAG